MSKPVADSDERMLLHCKSYCTDMAVFLPTLSQMANLLIYIIIGYILSHAKIVPNNSEGVLSNLENNVFVPALVLNTFMNNFTLAKIGESGKFLLAGLILVLISIPVAIGLSRVCTKDDYLRKIYTYGLTFSNFGFMGNAVVSALFPDVFMNYLIFVLPFWFFIYVWAVPALLIPTKGGKNSFVSNLKKLINPMFIAMFIGMLLGLLDIHIPKFVGSAVDSLGACMSPLAMILTGMTIAKIDLKATFKNVSIYVVSLLRLVAIPLVGIAVLAVFPISAPGIALCIICELAMPLGLNTIVVPAAYGKDTSVAAGLALISHLLSCITIPIIFMLFDVFVK